MYYFIKQTLKTGGPFWSRDQIENDICLCNNVNGELCPCHCVCVCMCVCVTQCKQLLSPKPQSADNNLWMGLAQNSFTDWLYLWADTGCRVCITDTLLARRIIIQQDFVFIRIYLYVWSHLVSTIRPLKFRIFSFRFF